MNVIRSPVESLDKNLFQDLNRGDVLFIDSSHIIRPQGDVLFEFLEILPILKPGVLIHVHDIFTPRDYIKEWIVDDVKFWNEQYLLEAFLSFNAGFKVIGALNYLYYSYSEQLCNAFPLLKAQPASNPGCASFWIGRPKLFNRRLYKYRVLVGVSVIRSSAKNSKSVY